MNGRSAKNLRRRGVNGWAPPTAVVGGTQRVTEGPATHVRGSDRRGERPLHPCALCEKTKKLELSHIVPKWAATWSKAEGAVVGDYESLGVITVEQDYPKHYMFCSECEQYLGRAEGYLAAIVRGAQSDLVAQRIEMELFPHNNVRLANVQMNLLFRSIVGIAFKMALAPSFPFAKIRIPIQAENEMRGALLSDSYRVGRFGILGYKIVNLTVDGANPKAYLGVRLVRSGGHEEFAVWLGGWAFWFVFGGTAKWEVIEGVPLTACWGDTFCTGVNEYVGEAHVSRGVDFRSRDFDRGALVEAKDSCPCGMNLTFETCCKGRWLPDATYRLVTANAATRALRAPSQQATIYSS